MQYTVYTLNGGHALIFFNINIYFTGKVELHGKHIEVEHSVPKKQRYLAPSPNNTSIVASGNVWILLQKGHVAI